MRYDDRKKKRSLRAFAALLAALLLLLSGCRKHEQPLRPEGSEQPQTTQAPDEAPEPEEPEEPEEQPDETPEEPEEPEAPEEEPMEQNGSDGWNLILVNADHPVPEGYTVTLKELRNDQWVDERIYPELQQMFDDARAEGIYPLINESFRSDERQQEILDSYTASYVDSGMSEDEALTEALTIVAVPGTSEHQLGLALDIVSETDEDDTATWQWLEENCWRYGFILRYPADKTEITGIAYEPWHFRYVGQAAAKQIMEQGITLEEYLGEA